MTAISHPLAGHRPGLRESNARARLARPKDASFHTSPRDIDLA